MNFSQPLVLLALILVAFMAVFLYLREREREALVARFVNFPMLARLAEQYNRRAVYLSLVCQILGLALLIVALAGPQWGASLVKVERQSLDIFFAVDCSRSMAAQDLKPERMEAAKRELTQLTEHLQGNRLGLIGFAGSAFVFCPLTLDVGATQLFLRQLDQDAVQVPGTAIGDAIRLAIESFPEKGQQARVLIVITDGEDHHSEPLKAAEEASRKGITIYTVGVGSQDGAPVPNQWGGYIRDDQNEPVISKLDEATLQEVASKTGGLFARADGRIDPLKPILKAIENSERQALESQMKLRYQERFQIFLGLALGLFALAFWLEGRKAVTT